MLKSVFSLMALVAVLVTAARTGLARGDTPDPAHTARQILEQAMVESNPQRRQDAVVALSLSGRWSEAVSLLTTALDDKDVEVRIAACASLSELKEKQSIPLLKKALGDPVPEVRFASAKALAELNDPVGEEIMIEVLAREKKTSSGFISQQKRDSLRLLKEPGELFKLAAKTGIGFIPLPGVGIGMTSVQGLMSDSGVSGRAVAALLLARQKDRASLNALRGALSDSDWSVRAAAVHSIALRGETSFSADLVPLFDDKKSAVRYRAAAAYLCLQAPRVHAVRRRR
ncbi:MAG TPA: HEAT repeat domain-containing protein [Blastocatellia bacterium]|nr:HEAT repeat domain-containing protein [Blastocatellia bacterium]